MRLSSKLIGSIAGLMIILSCGGGGGGGLGSGGSSQLLRSDRITVPPTGPVTKQLGAVDVTIPAGTFAGGTVVTVNQYNQANSPFMVENTNCRLAAPAVEIQSPTAGNQSMSLRFADNGHDYIAAYAAGDSFVWQAHTSAGGKIIVPLPKGGTLSPNQGNAPGKTWRFVLTISSGIAPDNDFKLLHLSGGNDFGAPGTVLYVGGLFSKGASMAPLNAKLSPLIGGVHCFALQYPWYTDHQTFVNRMGTILDQARNRGKNITIIAHSRGGVLTRFTLERTGKTHAVKQLVTLGTPHTGSALANAADLLRNFHNEWLNGIWDCSPFSLRVDSPALQELSLGSSFLQTLNGSPPLQRGQTDYTIVACGLDMVVPLGSGLGNNVNLASLTAGRIVRDTVDNAGHSSIKSQAAFISEVAELINNNATGVTITVSPLVAQAVSDGWELTTTFRNTTTKTIKIVDWSMDNYVRDGSWTNVQYYDPTTPSGEFYPNDYRAWNKSIGPNSTLEIDVHRWPDFQRNFIWQTAAINRAGWVRMTIRGLDGYGRSFEDTSLVELRYGDIVPAPAQTRRPNQPGGGSLVGPR